MSTRVHQGYLKKWVNVWKGWKTRFFLIQEKFMVYKEKPESKTKGTINLEDSEIRTSPRDALKIVIKSAGNSIKLRAGTAAEKEQWVRWLTEAKTGGAPKVEDAKRARGGSDSVPEQIREMEEKNMELASIIQQKMMKEKGSMNYSLAKVLSIQLCMEDTLATFVTEMESISENVKLKNLAERLEALSTDLKTVVLDTIRS